MTTNTNTNTNTNYPLPDFKLFYSTYKHYKDPTTLLFFEVNLLPYRNRLYTLINPNIILYLLPLSNINLLPTPLYLHKPTIFFHILYTCHTTIIKHALLLHPTHHIHNQYSLLTAIKLKHLPTIKLLIPHTHIHFPIQNTTPYLYVLHHFKHTHPIYLFFQYIHTHKYAILLLIHRTTLPIHILQHIKSFLI